MHNAEHDLFEDARPRLWSIAYRMLGSVADAEDILQDIYIKWIEAHAGSIQNPQAWLTTVCTRACIDVLKAAQRKRVDYVGTWLPDPVLDMAAATETETMQMSASLTTAFMLMLERLMPKERAVYLLREIFEYSYADTARAVNVSEVACRQINARLKKHLHSSRLRSPVPAARGEKLLSAFMKALSAAKPDELEVLLSEDVEFWSDGGGKAPAMMQVVRGRASVSELLSVIWDNVWHEFDFERMNINRQPGLIMRNANVVVGTLCIESQTEAGASVIYVVRNPEKLQHLQGI